MEVTSENSLAEVHQLHCAASLTEVKKEIRDIFVKGDLNDVKANFQVSLEIKSAMAPSIFTS